ncbi:hypothetical protein CR152_32435 (plasmid) [Massilia violaceinigra]|uniref:Histidine kinase domain-containing protein n=1 Tax=Massilia violaceinigra TaxID=2045208 RepID=A0A2D2DWD5_9BURK|nr:hypothetical protein CR152_32435 [Massilia violaceinigra]
MAARGHSFAFGTEDAPVVARGDANRLVQAVANLLQNAAKFTPPGGSVELSMACDGVAATISVRDNGVGIEPALLPHVFELFTQGERSSERAHGGLGWGFRSSRAWSAFTEERCPPQRGVARWVHFRHRTALGGSAGRRSRASPGIRSGGRGPRAGHLGYRRPF